MRFSFLQTRVGLLTAALALGASGCATVVAPAAHGARTVSVSGGSQLELLGRASPAELDAFGARFLEHHAAGRDVCCRALVEDAPDLALDLLRRALRAGDVATAEPLARALEAVGLSSAGTSVVALTRSPQPSCAAWAALATGEAALAARDLASARARATESRAALEALGDRLGVADADVVLALAAESSSDGPSSAGPSSEAVSSRGNEPRAVAIGRAVVRSAQDARIALELAARRSRAGDARGASESFDSALRFARGVRDLGLALDVEAQRTSLGVTLAPAELASWLRSVAALALDRKRPLVALRCALDAEGASSPGDAFAARALVARAQLASGRASVALDAALSLAKDAQEQGDSASEATGAGLAGEALLALDRAGDAAGAFERAAALARATGDSVSWARRSLNLARTQLRRGETADARALVDTLERALPSEGRLAARTALARACLLAAAEDFAGSRGAVLRALASAAACGDSETVEQALSLKRRLGNLGA